MVRIGKGNTQALIKSMTADGKVTARETRNLSAALIKDLAASGDKGKAAEQLGKNLEQLLKRFDADLKGSWGASNKIESLAGGLEDAQNEMADFGLGAEFALAMGIATEDEHLTVREAKLLGSYVDDLMAKTADKPKLAAAIRNLTSMFELSLHEDDGGIRDGMSKTAERSWLALDADMAREIVKGLGEPRDVQIQPDSMLAQAFADDDDGALAFVLPMILNQAMQPYSSQGLVGQAKFKMDQQRDAYGKAVLKFVADKMGGDPSETFNSLYPMVMGRVAPPGQEDRYMDKLESMSTEKLQDALADATSSLKSIGSKRGLTFDNQRSAIGQAIEMMKEVLGERVVDIPEITADLSSVKTKLGLNLTTELKEEVYEELKALGQQIELLGVEMGTNEGAYNANVKAAINYRDALLAVAFGEPSTILGDEGLLKDMAETPREIHEVGFALGMYEGMEMEDHPNAVALRKSVEHLGSEATDGNNLHMIAYAKGTNIDDGD